MFTNKVPLSCFLTLFMTIPAHANLVGVNNSESKIKYSATIVAETCESTDLENASIYQDLGDISLSDIVSNKTYEVFPHKDNNVRIHFNCGLAKKAKIKVTRTSDTCKGVNGNKYSCSENKTIGITPSLLRNGTYAYLRGDELVREVTLDDSGNGEMGIYSYELSVIEGAEPTPGRIMASYSLIMYNE